MWTFSDRSRASNQSNQQETTDERIGGDNGELVSRHGFQGRMRTEASSFGAELHLTLTAPTTRGGDQSEEPSPTLNARYVRGPTIHTGSAITDKLVEPLDARTGRRRCACGLRKELLHVDLQVFDFPCSLDSCFLSSRSTIAAQDRIDARPQGRRRRQGLFYDAAAANDDDDDETTTRRTVMPGAIEDDEAVSKRTRYLLSRVAPPRALLFQAASMADRPAAVRHRLSEAPNSPATAATFEIDPVGAPCVAATVSKPRGKGS
jgi:hypothetical protein